MLKKGSLSDKKRACGGGNGLSKGEGKREREPGWLDKSKRLGVSLAPPIDCWIACWIDCWID